VYVVFDFCGLFALAAPPAYYFASRSFFKCITFDTINSIARAKAPENRIKFENFLSLSNDAPSSSVV
jgi:hypothetical protein